MGRIYHRTPQKVNTFYHKLNIEELLVKMALNENTSAISDFDRAIHLNPSYSQAYYNRAGAKYVLDQYVSAITDYNKAIQLTQTMLRPTTFVGVQNIN